MTNVATRPPTEPTLTPPDANWTRLARIAAITMGIWATLTNILAGELIPPVLIIGVIFLAFVPFLRSGATRAGYGLAGFAVLALLGNLPFIADELAHPDSTPAFVLTLLSVTAALVAAVAGLGAARRWAAAAIRPITGAWVALFVIGAAFSFAVGANAESVEAAAGDVRVLAEKLSFAPETIEVTTDAGGFWIENRDGIRHTFTVEGAGIDLNIPALKARRVDADLAPGTYEVICRVPGHESMKATLTVDG